MNYVIVLQTMLDDEQEEMESAARVTQPRNTDSYDYGRYHPINEVSTQDVICSIHTLDINNLLQH